MIFTFVAVSNEIPNEEVALFIVISLNPIVATGFDHLQLFNSIPTFLDSAPSRSIRLPVIVKGLQSHQQSLFLYNHL